MQNLLAAVAVPKDPLDQIDLLLEHIVRKSDSPGSYVELNPATDYPLIFAKNPDEFSYCFEKAQELYLEPGSTMSELGYRLSTEGWKRLREIRKTKAKSDQAFVAMLFDDEEMDEAWEKGIEPALKDCGLNPLKIDLKEHNDLIIDHILAEIRRSGLLVAEFTGHSQGVYFESGFALGLDIPVIWSCKKEDMTKVHFDTSQYNHITWTTPEELKRKLTNRVKATLPFLVNS